MLAALTCIVLYLTALLQWNTIFLLALAAFLTGTVCFLTTLKETVAEIIVVAILGGLFVPKKSTIFVFLLLAVYVIVEEMLCKRRSLGANIPPVKEWTIKAAAWHILLVAGGLLSILLFSFLTGLKGNGGLFGTAPMECIIQVFDTPLRFQKVLHNVPTIVVPLLLILVADIFWILFDRAYLCYARMVNLRIKMHKNA